MRVFGILGCFALLGVATWSCLADPTDDAVHYGWSDDEGRTKTFEEESIVHWYVEDDGHFANLKLRFWHIGTPGEHQAAVYVNTQTGDPGRLLDPNVPFIDWEIDEHGNQTAKTYEFQGLVMDFEAPGDIVMLTLIFGDNLGDADPDNDVEIWRANFFLEKLGKTSWASINEANETSDGELFIEYAHTVSTTDDPEFAFGMQYTAGREHLDGSELWTFLDQFRVPKESTYIRRTFHWYPSPLPARPYAHFRQMLGDWPLHVFSKEITPH